MQTLQWSLWLGALAALIGAMLGAYGLFRPAGALALVGLRYDPERAHAVSEVRATYGGLFLVPHVAAGAALLTSPQIGSVLAAAMALAWGGAALGRAGSMLVDGVRNRHNLGSVVFEGLMALSLAAPLWAFARAMQAHARAF